MHHTFKEFKIGNSNEEALNKITLQNEDVLTLLKNYMNMPCTMFSSNVKA
jgi:hypothetical protein